MVDHNRIPRLLYYIYAANWQSYEFRKVIKLANQWAQTPAGGTLRVNAFSNCPAVRLLINGQRFGADQVPNPTTSDPASDLTENTTLLPGQAQLGQCHLHAGHHHRPVPRSQS